MPAFFNDEDELAKQQQQAQQGQAQDPNAQQPLVVGGQGGSFTSQQGATPSKEPAQSGLYTNLQQYLQANQGNGPASNIADQINQQGQQAQSDLQNAQQTFHSAVDAGSVKYDPTLIQQVGADPTKVASDPNAKQEFTGMRTATYKGPTAFNDQSPGQNAADEMNRVQGYIDQSKTENGRYALLQSLMNRPDYTRGQQGLDQMLLQNDSQSQQKLADAQSKYGGLGQQLSDIQKSEEAYAQQKKGETDQARAESNKALTDAETSLQSGVNSRAQQYAQQQQQDYDALTNALKTGQFAPDMLTKYGIDPNTATWGVDPTGFIDREAGPTAQTVATADEYARDAALAQLSGLDSASFLSNPSLAGQYDPMRDVEFNHEGFNTAAKTNQDAYNDAINKPQYAQDPFQGTTAVSTDPAHYNSLVQQIAEAKKAADWAQGFADPKTGALSPQFQPYVQQYQDLLNTLKGLQTNYGENKTFGNPNPSGLNSKTARHITYQKP